MTSKMQIANVKPVAGRRTLVIEWSNGKQHTVNLTAFIRQFPALAALEDPATFKNVQVGEWGLDVSWGNDLELAATSLYRLALEQAGEIMPTSAFKKWMARNKLSLTTAAEELGFTRRTITAYSSGAALIPKHVALACEGWEHRHKNQAA